MAFNSATGVLEWEAHYSGSTIGYARGTDVAVSPDGTKVFMTGRVPGPLTPVPCLNRCNFRYVTVAYDLKTGSQLWAVNYGIDYAYSTGSVEQSATGVAVSPDSATVYVTGIAYNGGANFAAATLGLDAASGAQKWEARYTPFETGDDSAIPTQVSVDPATGRVLVAALFEHTDASLLGPYLTYGVVAYAGDGLIAATSRKTHATAGPFDIELPLTGDPGIECRSGGANGNHQVVFKFASAVTVAAATCDGRTATKSTSGNETTVNCIGVGNAQTITVGLTGVSDGTNINDVSVQMGVLAGDTTADRAVNSADISQTKSQSGQIVSSSNFRQDVAIDGNINSVDIGQVKSKSGTALP